MKYLTIFLLFALTAQGQIVNTRWVDGNQSRNETFDMEYGNKSVKPPFKLAIERNGEYLIGNAALKVLRSEGFLDVLPAYTPQVKQYLSITLYPWYGTDTLPSTDQPYGYECKLGTGGYWQGATLETLSMWEMMGVYEWRPFNPTKSPVFKIENPLWEPVQQAREREREQYALILAETFTQMGAYAIPTMKAGAKWYVDGEAVDEWPYVSKTGGLQMYLKPVREHELNRWDLYASASIVYAGENRLRMLLGLKIK